MNDAELHAFKRGFSDFCFNAGLSKEAAEKLIASAEHGEKQAFIASPSTLNRLLTRVPRFLRNRGGLRSYLPITAAGAGLAAAGAGAGTLAAGGATALPNLYMSALPYLVGIGGAAGLAAGAGIGHGLASLDDDAETPEQIKAKELAQTYQTYADQIKAKRQYNLSREG